MYAARQRHQKHCSFIVAQKVARLARWLERRARTAEPSAGLMAVRSQPHTKHRTYDGGKTTPPKESARWKRGGGVKALALAGAAWQSTRGGRAMPAGETTPGQNKSSQAKNELERSKPTSSTCSAGRRKLQRLAGS